MVFYGKVRTALVRTFRFFSLAITFLALMMPSLLLSWSSSSLPPCVGRGTMTMAMTSTHRRKAARCIAQKLHLGTAAKRQQKQKLQWRSQDQPLQRLILTRPHLKGRRPPSPQLERGGDDPHAHKTGKKRRLLRRRGSCRCRLRPRCQSKPALFCANELCEGTERARA